jgi:hypothetical protein
MHDGRGILGSVKTYEPVLTMGWQRVPVADPSNTFVIGCMSDRYLLCIEGLPNKTVHLVSPIIEEYLAFWTSIFHRLGSSIFFCFTLHTISASRNERSGIGLCMLLQMTKL